MSRFLPLAIALAFLSVAPAAAEPLSRSHIVPIPFFTPETSGGLTVLYARLFRFENAPEARPSYNVSSASATLKGQFQIENRGEVYLDGEDWAIAHRLGGRKWPNRYYGRGNHPDVGNYEPFEGRSFEFRLDAGYRAYSRWYAGPMLDLRFVDAVSAQAGGALAGGSVTGSRPNWTAGVGGSLSWDSRDSNLNAMSGVFQESVFLYYPSLGADGFEFGRVLFDIRGYWSLFENQLLALRAMAEMTFGEVPFTALPQLGGNKRLRGIVEPWVTDKVVAFVTAEYRWRFWWKLGLAAFAGAGQAAPGWSGFRAEGIHLAGGLGLRLRLLEKEKVNLRADFATSDLGALQGYIGVGESF